MFAFTLFLCLLLATTAFADDNYGDNTLFAENEEDEITDPLPGLNFEPNFKHYSGFLQVSPTHFLHYWFVTSQGDAARDPLVFWFNGGPGCSSLDGLLNEMGPYVVNPDGRTLRKNPYAWNKYASMVYIEAPAGVGFSYASDGNTTTNDDLTSLENYEAIKQFFAKHPTFRNHSVFITGESYGGVYVPTLTARLVQGQAQFPINLRGMAIGNGYVNAELNIDTSVRFAYAHGIIDEKIWNQLKQECCRGCIDGCDLTQLSGSCGRMVEDIFEFLWHGGLNPYDLYRDCDPNPGRNSVKMEAIKRGVVPSRMLRRFYSNATRTMRRRLQGSLRASLYGTPSVPCMNDTDMTTYMNSADVRKALHIPANVGHWDICSDDITENYQKQYDDTSPFFKTILGAHVRTLLYYGDTDMACNFMLGQQFSARLGYKRAIGKQPWKFDRQVGGFKTIYAKGLTYLTVRGAGHMAPQWKAPQMDYVISQFLLNHPI
uniref:Carboxypeptidase n=1 Tax=Radopholus similis TaxID=46012 RepID=A0A068B0X0_RADSI|nr:serine carboxypeptidases [Radopholus similis]